MKNLHILTNNCSISNLVVIGDKLTLIRSNYYSKRYIEFHGYQSKAMYITNDEEIKEDYVIAHGVAIKVMMFDEKTLYFVNGTKAKREDCKKIILTTDQDLIKDGVQGIDDEFLEWFVKNPSCEMVEISPYHVVPSYLMVNEKPLIGYKIIVPKEESKQEIALEDLYFKNNPNRKNIVEDRINDFTKDLSQEALEEVAEKLKGKELFKKSNDRARKLLSEIELLPIAETLEEYIERETKSIIEPSLRAAAIAFLRYGAKWQAEQDKNKFSEEEMENIVNKTVDKFCTYFQEELKIQVAKECFEQFKKKQSC